MITLRDATPADTDALSDLKRTSFCAKFAHLYAPDDLERFLRESYAPEVVAAEIADPTRIHRLAVEGERLVGYCKLGWPSPYARFSDARSPIALLQLYTHAEHTGRGIGSLLMDWTLGFCREREADALQLSVFVENQGAQRFYLRNGFEKVGDVDFWVGSQRDHDLVFERRLISG